MKMIHPFLSKIKKKLFIMRLKKAGLKISSSCRLIGTPNFGSEPYLVDLSGENCVISDRVSFITHDGATSVFRTQERYKNVIRYGPIIVRSNCFIGYGAIILPNVVIGPNSIVGAGSVVTKDVPPNSIVAGNPARLINKVESFAEKCLLENLNLNRELYKTQKRKALEQYFFGKK